MSKDAKHEEQNGKVGGGKRPFSKLFSSTIKESFCTTVPKDNKSQLQIKKRKRNQDLPWEDAIDFKMLLTAEQFYALQKRYFKLVFASEK